MADAEPKPEGPPPLSDEYHRARRNLNLASGLFFAWEFVGIDLAKPEQEAAGFHIVIKSPGAVPWVLLALVVFFAARFVIEWQQCDPRRRAVPAASWDLRISGGLAALSIAVFAYQKLTNLQLYSSLGTGHSMEGALGAMVVYGLAEMPEGVMMVQRATRTRSAMSTAAKFDAIRSLGQAPAALMILWWISGPGFSVEHFGRGALITLPVVSIIAVRVWQTWQAMRREGLA